MKHFWPWLCALLSGILLALCFPPVGAGGLAWIGLTPLICALWFSEPWKKHEDWRILLLGYVTGVVYFLGCLAWLITVTVVGWIALCLYLGIYVAIWASFVGSLLRPKPTASDYDTPPWLKSSHNLRVAVLASACWVALEWLRGVLFTGFGWNGLGVALHNNLALIQIADVTGVGGISFLLVMVNLMIVLTVKRLLLEIGRQQRLRPHYDFSITVALVALCFGYGVRELFAKPVPTEPLFVAAVQGNVPILEKRDPAQETRILELHVKYTKMAFVLKPDLVIWPEAATPSPLLGDQLTWDTVRGMLAEFDGDFLTGTVSSEGDKDYNSVALLTEKASKVQFYHKNHLVPYGEYLPLRNIIPFPRWITSQIPDDFDFGPRPVVLQMKHKPVKIGPLICFEDTLGNLARRFALDGAQLFVTVTNDGWFLQSAGSSQHLNQALFRSVETKLPMVRAANTGVTCVIDRFGRVTKRLEDHGTTFIAGLFTDIVPVPTTPALTFYTRYGELFSYVCLAVAAFSCVWPLIRRKSA